MQVQCLDTTCNVIEDGTSLSRLETMIEHSLSEVNVSTPTGSSPRCVRMKCCCCSSPRITAGCLAVQTGLGALTLEARNGSPSAKLKGLSSYRAIAAPRVESCCDLPGPNSRASV